MNTLIVGGTAFLGRHIADALLERGHAVTLFNRGITDKTPRDGISQIYGDRETDLSRLGDRTWDAVIDTSCFKPSAAQTAVDYFSKRTARYVFISTISVHDLSASEIITEETPLLNEPPDEYGPAKARCEGIVRAAFGERTTIVRPGLIVGPYDKTDRFTYWPVRIAEDAAPILAPVAPSEPAQFIDARDLARFIISATERNDSGTYNVTSPRGCITMGGVIDTCKRITGSKAEVVWASEAFLEEQQVEPWTQMTLWVGEHSGARSIVNADVGRAVAAGLTIRPLEETVRATLAWAHSDGRTRDSLRAGITAERERELLSKVRVPTD